MPRAIEVQHGLAGKRREFRAVGQSGATVHIGAKAEQLACALRCDHGLNHAQIIADVQGARRLYARKNAHGKNSSIEGALSSPETPRRKKRLP